MLGEVCDPAHVNIIVYASSLKAENKCDSHIQVEYIFPCEILWSLWFIILEKSLKNYLGSVSQTLTQLNLRLQNGMKFFVDTLFNGS